MSDPKVGTLTWWADRTAKFLTAPYPLGSLDAAEVEIATLRAALDVCWCGYPSHGGWCPSGRPEPCEIAGVFADAAREALPGFCADSLDAAWAEAKAELPEGWAIRLGPHLLEPTEYTAEAAIRDPFQTLQHGAVGADGPTPSAALRALAAKLREVGAARDALQEAIG